MAFTKESAIKNPGYSGNDELTHVSPRCVYSKFNNVTVFVDWCLGN